LENKFYDLEFHHVVWADNEAADKLSKLGSTRAVIPHGVFVHDLVKLSIEQEEKPIAKQPSKNQLVAKIPSTGTYWREPFIRYLTSAEVPQNKAKMELDGDTRGTQDHNSMRIPIGASAASLVGRLPC
jgi:hypothetical protein